MREYMVYDTCPYCGHLESVEKKSARHHAASILRRQMVVHISKCILNPLRSKTLRLFDPVRRARVIPSRKRASR